MDNNLEELIKIRNILDLHDNVEELKEYIEVLMTIEKEYQD